MGDLFAPENVHKAVQDPTPSLLNLYAFRHATTKLESVSHIDFKW